MRKDNPNYKIFTDKETPNIVEVELQRPLTVEETVQKHLLRQQYMQNLQAIAERSGAGENIDDEFTSDEEAFTAAELNYVKGQEEFKQKKEAYFKAAQEKSASEMALKNKKHKEEIEAEYARLNPPKPDLKKDET